MYSGTVANPKATLSLFRFSAGKKSIKNKVDRSHSGRGVIKLNRECGEDVSALWHAGLSHTGAM